MDLIWLPLFALGLFVMAAEMLVFSFGVFLVIGAALAGYALFTLSEAGAAFGQPLTTGLLWTLIGATVLVMAVTLYFAVKAFSHRAKPLLEDERVEILGWADGRGQVRAAGGEIWAAVSDQDFTPGEFAIVSHTDNLTLHIIKET